MGNAPRKLAEEDINKKLELLEDWQRDGDTIAKEFVLDGFSEAAAFISKIAPIADAMDHHPDVQIYKYKRVKIILTTHSAGGLTQNDFDLASRIDALV